MKHFKFLSENRSWGFDIPEGYELYSVTPTMLDPVSIQTFKGVVYRHMGNGSLLKVGQISEGHELWNYENI